MRTVLLVGTILSGALRATLASPDPCALLTPADIETLAGRIRIPAGIATTLPAGMGTTCRFKWGSGANAAGGLWTLDINIGAAAKLYPGMGLSPIKQGFAMQTKPDPANAALISGAGEAAVYTSESPLRVNLTADVKGQILQIGLEGPTARGKREPAIALLKVAASRV